MKLSKIGVVGFKAKSHELISALEGIAAWAKLHPEIHFYVNEALRELVARPFRVVTDKTMRSVDLLLAVGGDGTVLSTARIALGTSVPILGVNAGKVGFLAETRAEDLQGTLDKILSDNFQTRKRIMMDAKIYNEKGKLLFKETVLNEVLVRADGPERMVNLTVDLDHKHLTEYWADSLVLSTPTGSTAYNLSAGGPLIFPSSGVFVLTPIAPSSLSMRPLVMPASLECRMASIGDVPSRLVFDGRISYSMQPKEYVVMTKSNYETTFIRIEHGFMDALREKLGWSGKPKLGM